MDFWFRSSDKSRLPRYARCFAAAAYLALNNNVVEPERTRDIPPQDEVCCFEQLIWITNGFVSRAIYRTSNINLDWIALGIAPAPLQSWRSLYVCVIKHCYQSHHYYSFAWCLNGLNRLNFSSICTACQSICTCTPLFMWPGDGRERLLFRSGLRLDRLTLCCGGIIQLTLFDVFVMVERAFNI